MTHKLKGEGYGIKQKIAAVAITVTISGAAIVMPFAALADTTSDTIVQLQAQIASLTAQLNALAGTPATPAAPAASTSVSTASMSKCTFTRPLKVGSKGDDVMCLQETLNAEGYQIAASGPGSPGNETTYFGGLTRAAVAKWQAATGVSPAVGYFGPLSQAKYNSMVAVMTPAPAPAPAPAPVLGGQAPAPAPVAVGPAGSGVTVTAAVDQPAAALAPFNAARVPFTKVVFTASPDGDVTVNSLTVQRQGPGKNSRLSDVLLLDENMLQLGLAKTLNSLDQANLNEAFVVKAGTSRTMTLAANRAAEGEGGGGEIIKLALVAVDAGTSKVTLSSPLVGNGMTINTTLSIGAVTNQTGAYKTVATTTEEIGKKAFVFTSVRVSATSAEKVYVDGIRWNQVGSVGSSDLANVMTTLEVVGGEKKDYAAVVSTDGKYYTSRFDPPILLDKGGSAEIFLKADIMGGSDRTIKFNIYRRSDLMVRGETYGFGITPPASGTGFTSTNPWYFASQITVGKGSINIENSTSVTAQNVASNLSGQPLGAFTADVRGEAVSVGTIIFNISVGGGTAAATGDDLTQVSIYDPNGKIVAGPVDGVAAHTLTFTDTVTFPVGKNVYTLKAKYGTDIPTNAAVAASTTPSSDWQTVRGVTTGETVTPAPTSAVTLSTMTVKAGAMTISVSSNPPAQTVVAGAQKFLFAKYLLDAGASGEDLRMPSIPLALDGTLATNLTACQLYDGATTLNTGTNTLNPSGNSSTTLLTFDGVGFTIPKGTVKTLDMKCNIASGATGVFRWGYDASEASPTITGLTSGQTVTPTENDSSGQRMTITASGSFTVALDSSSPSYTLTAAGRTAVTASVFRLTATNEAIRLTDFGLQLGNGGASSVPNASSSPQDVSKVTLWDGATKVGEAVFVGQSYYASTTLSGDFVIPKDGSKLLTAKVDISSQGVSQAGTPGTLVQIDVPAGAQGGTLATGQASGQRISVDSLTTATASAGVRAYRSYPTVELVPLASTKFVAGRPDLFRFKVTAGVEGDVGIAKFTVRIATSSATTRREMVDNVNIYVFTDSSFSTVATGLQSDGAMLQTSVDLSSVNADTTGISTSWNSSATDIEIWAADSANASTTVIVPAGGTRYFVVRADTLLPSDASFSVSTQLQGDAKFAADLAVTGPYRGNPDSPIASSTYLASTTYLREPVAGVVSYDFVWRPFSTTTAQSNVANDFSTGYGIPGLPTTNTNTQILTQ